MPKIHVLILAGGSGTRLWPLSREELPKQFLPLIGERTLLQETVLRLVPLASDRFVRVIAGREWQALVRHQVREVLPRQGEADPVLIEPVGRNTCPAIALGLAALRENASASEDDIVLVCPSDHVIRDEEAFRRAVHAAAQAAEKDLLVTFGIKGGDRTALNALLRELAEDGKVERRRGRLIRPGDLPPVGVVEVTG